MDMEKTDEARSGSALVQIPERIATELYPDDADDPFICLICLELVHKPVVNACGHMFCFLCVHRAMNCGGESYCPVCRRQYMHFPRICEQLHFFLLKALPDAYRRRCEEAHAEEIQENYTSPQFDDGLQFYLNDAIGGDPSPSSLDSDKQPASGELQPTNEGDDSPVEIQESFNKNHSGSSSSSSRESERDKRTQLEARTVDCDVEDEVSSSFTSIARGGLLCSVCKDLLCRPVVLNCGHVFCEGCVTSRDGAQGCSLKCLTCGSCHPGQFPSVFLELHHYLDKTFTTEYARRHREMDLKALEREKSSSSLKENVQPSNNQGNEPKLTLQTLHVNVGCDGCGIFPMTGRRFKCQDCGDVPGYDLCLSCFESQTILVGRFNQKHIREHRMIEIGSRYRADEPPEDEFMGGIDELQGISVFGRIPNLDYLSNPRF